MDRLRVTADLHLHGLYSGAVSSDMVPKVIAEQAPLKGIQLLGTADILNNKWLSLLNEQLKYNNSSGLFEAENGIKFILQTEVEDKNQVHHLILFPSLSKVQELRESIKKYCKDLDSEGRPKLWLSGEQIAEFCRGAECLIGFAHAFTPYFGLFSKFNSYKECYGNRWRDIHFLELGLSADTSMADRISELHELTFTSNSDAHSPWPNKLGREFNMFEIQEISFDEIKKALQRKEGRKPVLNVKFNPLEGKYHKTRCRGCLKFFEPKIAQALKWRCNECGASIKKGVDYRIEELSDCSYSPEHRPKCLHIIPLSEIIALALNINNPWSEKVQELWKKFVKTFGSEIRILLEIEIKELNVVNEKVAKYIEYFRKNKIRYIPGGAGVYGKLLKPEEEFIENHPQKNLSDFSST